VRAGLYDAALSRHGLSAVSPSHEDMRKLMSVIYGVKASGPDAAQALRMREVIGALGARGAEVALLACTELSLLASRFPGGGTMPEVDAAEVVAGLIVARATAAPG
jgi:aspartate racemase